MEWQSEPDLLEKIQKTPPGAERDLLIDKLEGTPKQYRTFYQRWHFVHDVHPLNVGSDFENYDPLKSKYPKDVQLLVAADLAQTVIACNGFYDFFIDPVGILAP